MGLLVRVLEEVLEAGLGAGREALAGGADHPLAERGGASRLQRGGEWRSGRHL